MGAFCALFCRRAPFCLLEVSMKQKLSSEWRGFCILLRTIPCWIVSLFVLSVFSMNLLANKSISLPTTWLALDCGILVSWFSFLAMDTVTKHFGPKAATQLSVFAMLCSLLFCLLFYLGSLIPGVWGESYVEGSETIIITALDHTFGGTWYVIFGSAVAFLCSAAVNNALNWCIGKSFRRNPDGIPAYIARTYLSTAVGQFTDNLIFALLVSHFFFGWSLLQCVTCSLTGMLVELIFEIVFSPIGYAVCRRWKKEQVGAEYFAYRDAQRQGGIK